MTKQEKIERYVQVGDKWRKVDRVPDMVEVVRCKDCKCLRFYEDGTWWCEQTEMEIINPNWFCAYGEEKNDDTRESNRDFKG